MIKKLLIQLLIVIYLLARVSCYMPIIYCSNHLPWKKSKTFSTKLQTERSSLKVINNAGLAGLRVGYGAFPLSIIEYLWRAKQPYNVSVAAEVSACAALQNPTYLEVSLLWNHCNSSFHSLDLPNLILLNLGLGQWKNVKNLLVKERERLFNLLKGIPFLKPFPSHSNFILCEVTSGKDAKKIKVCFIYCCMFAFPSYSFEVSVTFIVI